jgi:hypothetical protein
MVKTLPMCEVAEMSYQEIAKILSIPRGTAMHVWPEPGRQFAIHCWALPFHPYRETCLSHFQMH